MSNNCSAGEKLIGLSKTIDKVGIIGGVAVGVLFNPALGGLIAGGSIFSHELGTRTEQAIDKHRARKMGKRIVDAAS